MNPDLIERLGWLCVLFVIFLICGVVFAVCIAGMKRRDALIEKLSKHENAAFLIKEYSQARARLRKLFVSLGDKYADTASDHTIVELYKKALLKQQLRGEEDKS